MPDESPTYSVDWPESYLVNSDEPLRVVVVSPDGDNDPIDLSQLLEDVQTLNTNLEEVKTLLTERVPEDMDYSDELEALSVAVGGVDESISDADTHIVQAVGTDYTDYQAEGETNTALMVYGSFAVGFLVFSILGFLFVRFLRVRSGGDE